MNDSFPRSLLSFALCGLVAAFGFCAVASQIDPGGAFPDWLEGPGVTIDEGFNVEEGVRLVEGAKAWSSGAANWKEVFGQKDDLGANPPLGYHLADHPPAGRLWLGFWHQILAGGGPIESSDDLNYAYARFGSAAAFALLILVVGVVCSWWYGELAGVIAAGSLILMPRVFGHAHLASLETVMNLTYAAAILSVAVWWKPVPNPPSPPESGQVVFAGILWGLALLTKIQAVLIAPVVVIWTFWYWRKKAIVPLLIWGTTGLLVFFVGWPWLWFDPLGHAMEYFQSSTDRAALSAWYFGEKFTDTQTPWHYPFVMFLATIPVGLLFWGAWGIAGRDEEKDGLFDDGRMQLVLAASFFPLLLFAIPGVAVYDGARLFLVSFPLFAIAAGRGAACCWTWLRKRLALKAAAGITLVFLAFQSYGLWATSPCYLNYYNLLLGGLSGADEKGMETNYWGDALTRDFWNEVAEAVPAGSTVHVTPVLHPLQLEFLKSQLPAIRERELRLEACEPERLNEVRYLVHFQRKADLIPAIEDALESQTPEIEVTRQGVRLGSFYNGPF